MAEKSIVKQTNLDGVSSVLKKIIENGIAKSEIRMFPSRNCVIKNISSWSAEK